MRLTMIACVAILGAVLTGCSKEPTGPVEVTAEMEAAMKQEEQNVHDAESARQKTEATNRPLTAEEQELARQRQQGLR
jgi:hypothetical protein